MLRFHQILYVYFSDSYSQIMVNLLWINQTRPRLFLRYWAVRRLVIRPGAIGDFIVSLPAIECLRADYFQVWTASRNVPLVRFADRTRAIASTGLDLVGVKDPPPHLVDELR